ncbi:MAG: cell envelope protein SmpA [Cycloclasticus sp.]|nr:MAG: cell envelope protein SmpA [Cycloclasticus sp.]
MRKLLILISILISITQLIACSTTTDLNARMLEAADNLPGIYKINVSQGNLVTQDMVDQLRPGMDERQVKFLLGTPLLIDPFHANRWDYFYTLNVAGKEQKHERITLMFDEDMKLSGLKGNFKPSNEFKPMTINTEVVDVPKREVKEPGTIEKVLHSIGIEYKEKY